MKKLFSILAMFLMVVAVNAQRTPVKSADIPKAITDNVTKDFAGYTVKEATKIVENNTASYEVIVTKGAATETLLYGADGKFIKKVDLKAGTVAKPNPPAPAANKPAPAANKPAPAAKKPAPAANKPAAKK